MNWAKVFGVTVVSVLIVLFEWPQINRGRTKEKAALLVFTAFGWGLWLLLIFFPDLPGPTHFVQNLLRPLGRMLGE
ncbi:hypothetical protein [Brevibacillus marinus]|uniref:hypothetical protein n=1 Tax=Brevibacillus marinus TaxID=2496837 RepID=UPI000F8327D9|nr:hypothetical protein [Brevibacillus marinus]